MWEVLSPQVCASSVTAWRAKPNGVGKRTALPLFICEKREVKIINVALMFFLMAVATSHVDFVARSFAYLAFLMVRTMCFCMVPLFLLIVCCVLVLLWSLYGMEPFCFGHWIKAKLGALSRKAHLEFRTQKCNQNIFQFWCREVFQIWILVGRNAFIGKVLRFQNERDMAIQWSFLLLLLFFCQWPRRKMPPSEVFLKLEPEPSTTSALACHSCRMRFRKAC